MSCCQCQGIESVFDRKVASGDLQRYREEGPDKTTRWLIEALERQGLDGLTLLDIGGGVGAIQQKLLAAGVSSATSVEASPAYLEAAKEEARRQGRLDMVTYRQGNFVDLAPDISTADIVTLDRVICCYDDMHALVRLSSSHATKLYGVVFPRDTVLAKIGLALLNFSYWIRRNPFRVFAHSTATIERLVQEVGLVRRFHRKTALWQVIVYERPIPLETNHA